MSPDTPTTTSDKPVIVIGYACVGKLSERMRQLSYLGYDLTELGEAVIRFNQAMEAKKSSLQTALESIHRFNDQVQRVTFTPDPYYSLIPNKYELPPIEPTTVKGRMFQKSPNSYRKVQISYLNVKQSFRKSKLWYIIKQP